MTITDADIAAQVVTSLDGREACYDVPAIVCRIQERYGLVDIDTIDPRECWDLVARHDKTKD
jgi:hypothetical protein